MGDLLALGALFLFGVNAFVVRAASARLGQELGFLVALVANVAFGVVVFAVHQAVRTSPFTVDWTAFGLFALAGVFSSYLGRRGYFRTVQTIGPSRASTIQNSSPAFALVLAWVFLGQTVGLVDVALMAAVIGGLYLTGRARAEAGTGTRPPSIPPVEVAVALLSAGAYGVGNVIRGAAVQSWEEPVFGALLGALTGTAAYFVVHISPRALVTRLADSDRRGLLLWVLSGVLTICGQAAVIGAIAYLPVAVVVAISAATPVVVIPVSLLVLGNRERVDLRTVVGAHLIVAGVAWLVLR
jgi:drug/metabolite transporter (DMT)-like permease